MTVLPVVDLEAIGLVPDPPEDPVLVNGHRPRNESRQPAGADVQTEFRRLMTKLGIVPRRGGRETFKCTQHEDHDRSLSVDWDEAWLRDFSTGSGCPLEGTHGIRDLRQLMGEEAPPRPRQPNIRNGGSGHAACGLSDIDPETERSRLVHAMKASGKAWPFDHKTGRALWEQVLECHRAQVKYECIKSGHRIAYPFSCGFQLCPTCMPSRLRADFRRHSDNLPGNVALFLVTPPAGVTDRKEISKWYRRWRKTKNVTAGFYGIRLRIGRPDVLLVLPADQVPAAIVSDPAATLVAAELSIDQAVDWYVERYLEEISSWRMPEEMLNLLVAVKGRRRFQGFGKCFASKERSEEADDEQLSTGEEKKLYRASGGSAKGGSKTLPCPICGSKLRFVAIASSAEGMDWDSKLGCYRWGTGPPAQGRTSFIPIAVGAAS